MTPMPVGLFTTWIPCGDELQPIKSWRVVDMGWPGWVTVSSSFASNLTGGRSASAQAIIGGWLQCCQPDRLRVSRLLLARSLMLANG